MTHPTADERDALVKRLRAHIEAEYLKRRQEGYANGLAIIPPAGELESLLIAAHAAIVATPQRILASLIRLRGDAKRLRENLFDNPILRDPGNDHYREGYEDGLNDMADEFDAALLLRGKP